MVLGQELLYMQTYRDRFQEGESGLADTRRVAVIREGHFSSWRMDGLLSRKIIFYQGGWSLIREGSGLSPGRVVSHLGGRSRCGG